MEKKKHNRSRYFFTEDEIKNKLKITGKVVVFGPWKKSKKETMFCVETVELDEYPEIEQYIGEEK